ncbi:uncharacterized protein LOC124197160 [Daphnia pulex]|uniref:uncharacterized protein LOC124197160 n=1 Tax=Daphnia pulex TaxID=6669 RepID=UPI001EDF8531|nr:uncharacterized protein LOC124197160 [Daphnia pulex]
MIRPVIVLSLITLLIVSSPAFQLNFQSSKSLGRLWIPFRPFGPFYLSPLIATSTITATQLVPTTYTRTIDIYCLDGDATTCAARRKRTDQEQMVYIDGQPFQPSQVARLLPTEMPAESSVLPPPSSRPGAAVVTASMRSPDEQFFPKRQSRARNGQWFFATTTTVTLTAATVVNATSPESIRISIVGCIPNCLTTLPHC